MSTYFGLRAYRHFPAMEWLPLPDYFVRGKQAVPGLNFIDLAEFLKPFSGDVSRWRSLDGIDQLPIAALNALYVFAILSVIPAVSHSVSAYARWSEHALATTWLLTEVLDPVPFFIRSCRWGAQNEQQKLAPVQKGRVLLVSILFTVIVGIEMVFIVGQSTRETGVILPLSRFQVSLSPKSNNMIKLRSLSVGVGPSVFDSTLLNIPGTDAQARLAYSERVFYGGANITERSNSSATFIVKPQLDLRAANVLPISLFVAPKKPLDSGASGLTRDFALSILGLSADDNFFVPFSWIDTITIQSAVDAMAEATKSEECDWETRATSRVFEVYSSVEKCWSTITPELQHDIALLLGRLLTSRIRVGSFLGKDPNSIHLVDRTGASLKNRMRESSPILDTPMTDLLKSTKQLIPNTILIGLSCVFILLAFVRNFCLGSDERVINRDYKIVASALGWESDGSFARVNPDPLLPSLPAEDDAMRDNRFYYT